MKDEKWDIYDIDRIKTCVINRGDEFKAGQYHIVIHVCIINSRGEMLIQRRASSKRNWSDMWDFSVAGAAIAGETSRTAAMRETKEELGINLDLNNVRPSLTIHFDMGKESGFDDYFVIYKDIDLASLNCNEREVAQVKWATPQGIAKMIRNGEFIDYYESFVTLLFEIGKNHSCNKHSTIQ